MINEVWLGDCLDLLNKVPDKSVDLIVTDPPYGTTNCRWDVVVPFDLMWNQFNRIIKRGGGISANSVTAFHQPISEQ